MKKITSLVDFHHIFNIEMKDVGVKAGFCEMLQSISFFAVIVPFVSAHTGIRLFQSNIFKMDPQINIVQICHSNNFTFRAFNLEQNYSKNTF